MPGLESASNILAQMPDETYDYVQAKCLSLVQRKRDGDMGWTPIWGTQAERVLDDSIDGSESAAIMIKVLVIELAPFFLGLVSKFLAASQS
ncbi:phage tail assembly chaperone [Bosea sp. 2KB_26]|uniref:phage tail assembly chaperone n=1 Tax=Bosea sp. 2KB_26 TaxID=3237475 RepID=UPI003F9124D6